MILIFVFSKTLQLLVLQVQDVFLQVLRSGESLLTWPINNTISNAL